MVDGRVLVRASHQPLLAAMLAEGTDRPHRLCIVDDRLPLL
jgi:hypothetical protein